MDLEKKTPAISLIIPVFNSEIFLENCLKSIVNQTFDDFEVIIINDGSTDSSLDIIKRFVDKYSNFKLLDNKNQGAAISRNMGITMARGEYIAFVDSDDFVSKDFLQILYNKAKSENADIVCCNYYIYSKKSEKKHPDIFMVKSGNYEKKNIVNLLIKDFRMHYYIWNKLFKKSLFVDNNIEFKNMCFEDIVATPKLFTFAKNITVINKPLYYYVRHENSMVNNIDVKKFNDYLRSLIYMRNFFEIEGNFNDYKFSFFLYSLRLVLISFKLLCFIHKDKGSSKGFLRNLKRTIDIVKYCCSNKFKCLDETKRIEDIINQRKNIGNS